MEEQKTLDRLLFAILRKEDYDETVSQLTSHGFFVTRLSSSGGFLKKENVTLMLACMMLKGACTGSIMGTLNAYVAETSAYTFKTQGVHLDGTMFSCSRWALRWVAASAAPCAACCWRRAALTVWLLCRPIARCV